MGVIVLSAADGEQNAPQLSVTAGTPILEPDWARVHRELDREGVGGLIRMAIEKGRGVKGDRKVGICGEHGGNPPSVAFCHEAGLNYVSCSPYRVPIARLAAAQAALGKAAAADFCVGNDTGMVNVAAAVGRPSFVIIGSRPTLDQDPQNMRNVTAAHLSDITVERVLDLLKYARVVEAVRKEAAHQKLER